MKEKRQKEMEKEVANQKNHVKKLEIEIESTKKSRIALQKKIKDELQ